MEPQAGFERLRVNLIVVDEGILNSASNQRG
jgi:hypothetical protein